MIVQEGKTSTAHKQYVAQMLTGHLIEQWIENLIMFQWRHDNWIKEALVQYFEYSMLRFVSTVFYLVYCKTELENVINLGLQYRPNQRGKP